MIYIFCALYCEAHALIDRFGLVRDMQAGRFQVFENEEEQIRLTITGPGSVAAATAVGSICTQYRCQAGDFLVNIGTCGFADAENKIFLCNKIIERATGRTFYPDILYRHGFAEMCVVSDVAEVQENFADNLYDMEAAAVYQAGAYFFGPHQMSFLKVVSDAGDTGKVTPLQVEERMMSHIDEIAAYLKNLSRIKAPEAVFTRVEQQVERLAADMHCSQVMKAALRQLLKYCELSGREYQPVIERLYEEEKLPCKSKREGKIYFEELKGRLL